MSNDFFKMRGIVKQYQMGNEVQTILKGIDLNIEEGEFLSILGPSGSGKSTLMNIIGCLDTPTSGEYILHGRMIRDLDENQLAHIRSKEIGFIFQQFQLLPRLDALKNVELPLIYAGVPPRERTRRAEEMLVRVGLKDRMHHYQNQLSGGQQQRVAIARALATNPTLLLADEPTTALTAREVDKLWDIVRKLKEKGIAVMIVNHKLDEIYRIADRLTILRNGAYVSSGPISEYDQARFTRDMTGHDVSDEKYHPAENAEEILRVEHLTRKGAFEDVSFTLNRGDVLGLTGLLGSGRGEIGQALFGLTPAESGRIVLNGKEITIKSVNDAMANDIGYVPEDRLTQGLFMDRSIQDNTVASSIRKYMKGGKLDEQAMETVTRRWIDEINIVAPSPKPAVRTLSGGNAQKVVIAKWLNTDPKLFILDGPTVGVDIGAKAEIHAILRDLAQKGIGIIVISDDLPELVQNCNKIIVMRDGKVEAAVDNSIDELSLSNLLIGASDAAKSAAQTTEQEVEEK